jgi:uncharacterized delta-60 repeat protein
MRSCILLLSLLTLTSSVFAQSIQPDPLFGNAGIVVTAAPDANSIIYDIAFQPDGKIIAVGCIYENNAMPSPHTYLIRYNTNGTIDNSFGINGKVKTAVGTEDIAYAVVIQQDGKILIAGNETIINQVDSTSVIIESRPYLVRYKNSGTLDSAFGTQGIHKLHILDPYTDKYLNALQLRPDGTILAGGGVQMTGQPYQMMVVSLNPDGTYSNNFGTNGLTALSIEPGQNATLYDIALQTDGKLVLGGYSGMASLTAPPLTKMALARLGTNGAPDTGFGNAGTVTKQVSTATVRFDMISAIAVQDDGRIVAAGGTDQHFVLLRYHADGSPDLNFGTAGLITDTATTHASNLCIDHNGKLLISGLINYPDLFAHHVFMARYNTNGTPDLSFGNSGLVLVDQSGQSQVHAMAIQQDHKIVLAGHTEDVTTGNTSYTLFRYKDIGTKTEDRGLPGYMVHIYPNPAADILNISFDQVPKAPVKIRIMNAVGQTVCETSSQKGRTALNTQKLTPGHYVLQLSMNSHSETFKLEIKK